MQLLSNRRKGDIPYKRGEVKMDLLHDQDRRKRKIFIDVNQGNNLVKCDMLISMHEDGKRKLKMLLKDNDNLILDNVLNLNIYIKNIWISMNLMCTFTIYDLILISRSFKNTEIIYDDISSNCNEDDSIFKDGLGKRKNTYFVYFQNYKIRKNVVKIFFQNPYVVCFIHKNGSVHVHGALTLRKGLLILIKVIKRLKYKTFWIYLNSCPRGISDKEKQFHSCENKEKDVPSCFNQYDSDSQEGESEYITFGLAEQELDHLHEAAITGENLIDEFEVNYNSDSNVSDEAFCEGVIAEEGSILKRTTSRESISRESILREPILKEPISPDVEASRSSKESSSASDRSCGSGEKSKKFNKIINFCENVIKELNGKIQNYGQEVFETVHSPPKMKYDEGEEKKEITTKYKKYSNSKKCKKWIKKNNRRPLPSQAGYDQIIEDLKDDEMFIDMNEKEDIPDVCHPNEDNADLDEINPEDSINKNDDKMSYEFDPSSQQFYEIMDKTTELAYFSQPSTCLKKRKTQRTCENEFSNRKEKTNSIEKENHVDLHSGSHADNQRSSLKSLPNEVGEKIFRSKKFIYQFDTYQRWKYITRDDIVFDMNNFNIKQLVSVFKVKLRYFDISRIYKYREFKNIVTDINNIIYIKIDHNLLSKLIQQFSVDYFVQNNSEEFFGRNVLHPSVKTVLLFSSGNIVLYACKSRNEVLCVSRFIVNTLKRNNNIVL
ncbi:hypothetical protein, conserved [Plasmodium gonderi]|uniref:Uncharacterized protein n=1 Tax=Plasmodium gonderi TaxID=77519 RepID=A0A1Y1JAK5_PLAGO|nr:hypothetical protein, conserved [Plasmodium gonderi]GAW79290.1 hypothetical protein, conserved [Plasmodium gonderi]